MPVLSFFKRKHTPAAAGAVDEAASVQAARTRARRRLIGAAVLVGLGIIGFPLLFETQPRPIAVDVPIEIPARDGVPPLSLPAPKGSAPAASKPAAVAAGASAVEPSAPAAEPPRAAASAQPVKPAPDTASAERSREAQRAQALLEGKPVPPPAPPPAATESKAERFVVQAGAYSDPASLREARQKVEKLGLKTYIQVVNTEAGARTRVRVGPFDSREEADQAAARIKGSGLAVSVLRL